MKIKMFVVFLMLVGLFAVGCEDKTDVFIIDNEPAAPQGVYSVTGNGEVYLYWNAPYEADIEGFVIYRSLEPTTNYVDIAVIDADPNPNLDLVIYEYIDQAVTNGVTYYYAVSAFDKAGQVSVLSAEDVFDTPRPEGAVEIFDTVAVASASAFSFGAMARVSYTSNVADVFVDNVAGVFYLNASDTLTDLQDLGYTDRFDDVSYAPENGWSDNGWMELIDGHTYVIWTRDLHFAKLRVTSINANSVSFQWAYQTDVDNPELVAPQTFEDKPVHQSGYLNKSAATLVTNK